MANLVKQQASSTNGIVEAKSLVEMWPLLSNFIGSDWEETWFFWDLDETLVRPSNPVFIYATIKAYWPRFRQELTDQYGAPPSPEEEAALFNSAVIDTELQFVEPETMEAFKRIRSAGAKLIGLTATITGSLPPHDRFEVARARQCRKLGFAFSSFSPSSMEFSELATFRGNGTCYHQGILFANDAQPGADKGDVLCAFLDRVDAPLPKKIVFVDDTVRHLQAVQDILPERYPGIAPLCIEYTHKKKRRVEVSEDDFLSAWRKVWKRIHPDSKEGR